jgi:hypothetical protein
MRSKKKDILEGYKITCMEEELDRSKLALSKYLKKYNYNSFLELSIAADSGYIQYPDSLDILDKYSFFSSAIYKK